MEHTDTAADRAIVLQFCIESVKFVVSCQSVQLFHSLFTAVYQTAAQLKEATNVLVLDTIGLFHLSVQQTHLIVHRLHGLIVVGQLFVHFVYLLVGRPTLVKQPDGKDDEARKQ